jgi:transposase-like protein
MEKPRFLDEQDTETIKCPSCNRVIKSPEKELRVPATWYVCSDCDEKFDDALITFYCKEFDHDFTVDDAQPIIVYGYSLTNDSEHLTVDHQKLKSEISKVLIRCGFSVDENYTIKGKSGHEHKIDIYGNNNKNQTVFILINDDRDSEIDSKIIQILDTSPKIALIIGLAAITEKTKAIAAKYNVSIISSQNTSEIISEAEKILSYRIQRMSGVKDK